MSRLAASAPCLSGRELWDARGRYPGAIDTHPAAYRYPVPTSAAPFEPEPPGQFAHLSLYSFNSKVQPKAGSVCPNSRLVLAGAAEGKTHLVAVGCSRN